MPPLSLHNSELVEGAESGTEVYKKTIVHSRKK